MPGHERCRERRDAEETYAPRLTRDASRAATSIATARRGTAGDVDGHGLTLSTPHTPISVMFLDFDFESEMQSVISAGRSDRDPDRGDGDAMHPRPPGGPETSNHECCKPQWTMHGIKVIIMPRRASFGSRPSVALGLRRYLSPSLALRVQTVLVTPNPLRTHSTYRTRYGKRYCDPPQPHLDTSRLDNTQHLHN
jgi:hypothetical protein